ncbi:MAG: type III pantothenate kinase [Firmicutes bacterium]|nr:type III pantothenate kinase [Bacillota bacterium]
MLLTIDCGNTNIVLGLYEGDTLRNSWRISTVSSKTEDEYYVLFQNMLAAGGLGLSHIDGFIVSSVVPSVTTALRRFAAKYLTFPASFVDAHTETGVPIRIDNPAEVGSDRIVNALAGHHKYGGYLIIVDFGTATTFDVVSPQGEYLGGAICPGLEISAGALFAKAAKLANITMEKPAHIIGKNTTECLRSGLLYGYGCLVDGLIEKMTKELSAKPMVIATGGLGQLISEFSEKIDVVDQLLTLEGLRLLWEKGC